MTQDNRPVLLAGQDIQLDCNLLADSTHALFPADFVLHNRTPSSCGMGALGHNNNRVFFPFILSHPDLLGDFFKVVGNFRDQDAIGGTGNADIQLNPSRLAPHDFNDHDPLVKFGSRLQSIKTTGSKGNNRVKAKHDYSLMQIVIYGFGYSHDP